MGNLNHDAGTVTSLVTRLSTSVFHILQHLQCIIHQFVTLTSVDVHYHSYAARIVLVIALIETLIVKLAFCHIILTFSYFLLNLGCKINTKWHNGKISYNVFNLKIQRK